MNCYRRESESGNRLRPGSGPAGLLLHVSNGIITGIVLILPSSGGRYNRGCPALTAESIPAGIQREGI